MKKVLSLALAIVMATVLVFIGCAKPAPTPQPTGTEGLPKELFFSCYDVGSTGYMQVSAFADAVLKKYGTRIRLLPSGTSIGRLIPLVSGKVSLAGAGSEAYCSTEGILDFATREWGPQDFRAAWASVNMWSVHVRGDSDVVKGEDLRGKKVGWVVAGPTNNVKTAAALAFWGMTWDDVEKVKFPSYGACNEAVVEGLVTIGSTVPTASWAYKLEAMPGGIRYIEMPASDVEGWKRLKAIYSYAEPWHCPLGAGLSEQNRAWLPAYRYPQWLCYADTDPDYVYNLCKAVDETFDMYKDAHPLSPTWAPETSMLPPCEVPYHEGTIRFMKEKGLWTAEHDAWNEARIKHLKEVQAFWEEVWDMPEAQGLKGAAWVKFWKEQRDKKFGKDSMWEAGLE